MRDFVFEGCRLSRERGTGTLLAEDKEIAERLFLVQSEIVDIMDRYGFLSELLYHNIYTVELYQFLVKKVSEKKIHGVKPETVDEAYREGSKLAEIVVLMRSKLGLTNKNELLLV